MASSPTPQRAAITVSAHDPKDIPFFSEGNYWMHPPTEGDRIPADDPARSMMHGLSIMVEFADVASTPGYEVEMVFLCDSANRGLCVKAGNTVLEGMLELPEKQILKKRWPVSVDAVKNGILSFGIFAVKGPAILSSLTLFSPDGVPAPRPYVEEAPLDLAKDLVWPPKPESIPGVRELEISLNGLWQLHATPPENFWQRNDTDGWRKAEVPGEWEMRGVSVEPQATVAYQREFTVPADWSGKHVRMRFDAVYAECQVWLNGQKAGSHRGGFTAFELDVTHLVQYGNKNTIALAVQSRDTMADKLASGCRYADHDIGGILRKVSAFVLPEVHLSDVFVTTPFDAEYKDATVRAQLSLENASYTARQAKVRIKVVRVRNGQPDGKTVAKGEVRFGLLAPGRSRQTVELSVTQPEKWDPEHPNLYRLECEVLVDDAVTETTAVRFGFRQIEVRGNQVFVNGQPVKLRGVCRHETHPTRGRELVEPLWRRDAELYRAGNCNHIRTSHYPPAEEFLEACDELGLFVECEAPYCWAMYGGAGSGNPDVREVVVGQTLEMVRAYRNHPSVLFWSLANESSWGRDFIHAARLVREADPSRPRTFNYAGYGAGDHDLCEIASTHYPGPAGPDLYRNHDRPMNFGEYCHLNAYNRHELSADPGLRDFWGRAFRRMWDSMAESRGVLGGSIWAAMDDTFILPDGRMFGYGQWGPLDNWRRSKPEYWHMRKTYSPVRIDESNLVLEPAAVVDLPVQNRALFSNLSEFEIQWTIGTKSGLAKADLAPGKQGTIRIDLGGVPSQGDMLKIEVMDPRGFVADSYAFRFAEAPHQSSANTQGVKPLHGLDGFLLRAGSISVRISANDGSLKADLQGRPWLVGGPYLVLLPLNGAGGAQMQGTSEFAPFNSICENRKLNSIEVKQDSQVVVVAAFDEAEATISYHLGEDGALSIAYDSIIKKALDPRQVGLAFDLPAEFRQIEWRRLAPYGVYPDDHIGRPEGKASAFREGDALSSINPRMEPAWPWSQDETAGGTHDFRSTKERITEYRVSDKNGFGVQVCSDGNQHARAWVQENGLIRFLVADYSNLGGEGFLRTHALQEKRPLNEGDRIRGSVVLKPAE